MEEFVEVLFPVDRDYQLLKRQLHLADYLSLKGLLVLGDDVHPEGRV